MLERARRRAPGNVTFVQGDVGRLPFAETFRVLKRGGVFCGCFYIRGENRRTDWFINRLYTPKGFFTPPYETLACSLLLMAVLFLMIWAAVALARSKKLFATAPKDIQAAANMRSAFEKTNRNEGYR